MNLMVDKKAIVLLIEGNSFKVDTVSSALRAAANSDIKLETTHHLNQGLKRLGEGGVDLVLLDLPVKGLSHLDAFRQVREKAESIPLFIVGGGEDERLAAEASRQGVPLFNSNGSGNEEQLIKSILHTVMITQLRNELGETNAKLKTASERLEKLAHIDSLTDIFNRAGIERILTDEYNRAQRGGYPLIAIMLDCDDFDRINQSLGHRVGDVVLREIVGRMKETLRPSDQIARIGGDEFLLLLPETRLAEGMLVAEKIRLAVAESPLRLAHETIRVTASFGVLALPYEFCSIEELLSLVRLAVNESKGLGKNRVSSGEKHKLESGQTADKEALAELTEKLRQGDCFRAVSMPIFDLQTETPVGYEILSRGPAGAFEMPDDLFRVSVEYNLLTVVDLRCLKTCLQAITDKKFKKNARFHFNLFPSTILDTPIERLMSLLPPDIKPENLCLEISEQQFIGDPAYLRDHVVALKKHGMQVAIDDVGFGRSSLESLIILEPDIVKIDRKYVSGVANEPSKARLLKRLVKVVQALGAELVAEGIEEREELEMLLDLGVRYGQGWYWGKPA
jgi:diguanylate cyclase (GGDEF)-like protein